MEAENVESLKKKLDELEKAVNTLAEALMEHEHASPVSARCRMILAEGPKCEDGFEAFRQQRAYALCRAFELLEEGEVDSFGEGLRKAWDEIHAKCGF